MTEELLVRLELHRHDERREKIECVLDETQTVAEQEVGSCKY